MTNKPPRPKITPALAAQPPVVPMCSEQAVLHALTMARSETHQQGDAALWQAFGRAMWRQFNAMAGAAERKANARAALAAQAQQTDDGDLLTIAYMSGAHDARAAQRAAQAQAEGNAAPCGWFEGPHGAFRANPAFKMDWPPQSLKWQVPVYLRTDTQPKGTPDDMVLVRRDLLGAACAAIRSKRDAPKTLAALREVTMVAGAVAPKSQEEIDKLIEQAWEQDKAVCADDPRFPDEAFQAGAMWAIGATVGWPDEAVQAPAPAQGSKVRADALDKLRAALGLPEADETIAMLNASVRIRRLTAEAAQAPAVVDGPQVRKQDVEMAAVLMDEAANLLETVGPETLEKLPGYRWPLADELGGAASIMRDYLGGEAKPPVQGQS